MTNEIRNRAEALELRKIHSDELIVYDVELSEFIARKLIRLKTENPEARYSPETVQKIYDQLLRANITDPEVRKLHVERIRANKNSASAK